MHAFIYRAPAVFALLALANAQDRADLSLSLSGYPSLSLFRSLLDAVPDQFDTVLSKKSKNITVLIPTDDAINNYLSESGVSDFSELETDDIETFFAYHVMAASLKGQDFDKPEGVTVPTLLEGDRYNNRTAGTGLQQAFGEAADGQVLHASTPKVSGKRSSRRQLGGGSLVTLRAGLAQDVQMTAVDGEWGPDKVNSFQTVDNVLIPPRPCSQTVRSSGDSRLSGLDTALNRTKLWPALDSSKNVTCLAPSSEAFKDAGNPETELGVDDLTGALLAHTLKEVTYTDYLKDGQVLGTLNDTEVVVHIRDTGIYFNNAKVIKPNVLTNNGLIHILDSVIGPDDDEDEPSGTSGTSSDSVPSPTTVESPSATNDASRLISFGTSAVVTLIVGLWIM